MTLRKVTTWAAIALLILAIIGWLMFRNTSIGAYFANTFSSSDWQADANHIEVSISPDDTHIVIPVYLNGEGPFRFVLDTGAPMTAIFGSSRTATLNLEAAGDIAVGGAGSGNGITGSIVNNVDIGIGTLKLNQQTLIVMPWKLLPFAVGDTPQYDGVIGFDLFKRYPVEIDLTNHLMRIHEDLPPAAGESDTVLPISFSGRKPYLTATTTLTPDTTLQTKLQMDIGSNGTLSLLPGALPEIKTPESTIERHGWGLSGRVTSQVARIPSLTLGDIELHNVITAFSVSGAATSGNRHGLIGLGVLERFDLLIDYPAKRVVLSPTDRLKQPFEIDMAGMDLVPENDQLLVRHVYPGSAAENVGIQTDDRIVSINGRPSNQ
ncbi:MAG: aspartyl protease family protein, partial [Pseudomonadota bacterium]